MHKFRVTWLTGPTVVARDHGRIFLDGNSSTFNVKLKSTFFTADRLMDSCNIALSQSAHGFFAGPQGSDEYSRVEFHMDYNQHLGLGRSRLHD